jgi:hypothetical protein
MQLNEVNVLGKVWGNSSDSSISINQKIINKVREAHWLVLWHFNWITTRPSYVGKKWAKGKVWRKRTSAKVWKAYEKGRD